MDAAAALYDPGTLHTSTRWPGGLSVMTGTPRTLFRRFSQAWRTAARYQSSRASVVGWLLMMTRTRAIDRLRARQARPDMRPGQLPDSLASSAEPASDLLLAAEQAGQVRDALDALPAPQRTALQLAYCEGLTQAEIAMRLSEPLGTVKTRMRTALTTLRQRLQG